MNVTADEEEAAEQAVEGDEEKQSAAHWQVIYVSGKCQRRKF